MNDNRNKDIENLEKELKKEREKISKGTILFKNLEDEKSEWNEKLEARDKEIKRWGTAKAKTILGCP